MKQKFDFRIEKAMLNSLNATAEHQYAQATQLKNYRHHRLEIVYSDILIVVNERKQKDKDFTVSIQIHLRYYRSLL